MWINLDAILVPCPECGRILGRRSLSAHQQRMHKVQLYCTSWYTGDGKYNDKMVAREP
jgi:hypothetical protein